MKSFTLLQLERVGNDDIKTRVTNVADEIAKDCQLTFQWEDMLDRYVISISKFNSKEQLGFAVKVTTSVGVRSTVLKRSTVTCYHTTRTSKKLLLIIGYYF